jgi:anaerobic nitric oxide reductase transcription regulator
VRELENAVSRAILRAVGRTPAGEALLVQPEDLGDVPAAPSAPPETLTPAARRPRNLRDAVRDFQRELVRETLAESDGNWAAAARALGLHRSNLHHLARRLGLR